MHCAWGVNIVCFAYAFIVLWNTEFNHFIGWTVQSWVHTIFTVSCSESVTQGVDITPGVDNFSQFILAWKQIQMVLCIAVYY